MSIPIGVVISAPVGDGAKANNRPDDVRAIQQLLNDIPTYQGGAVPKLKVDGKCGYKTRTAIQQFQLRHFGWKLADGRVDPAGPTLIRMNECVGPIVHRTTQFRIRRSNPDNVSMVQGVPEVFEVQDKKSLRNALYIFTPADSFGNWGLNPLHANGEGSWTDLTTTAPSAVWEIGGRALIIEMHSWNAESHLAVYQSAGFVAADLRAPVDGSLSGNFQFAGYP